MKIKVIKIERKPEDKFGITDPRVTIELPDGSEVKVRLSDFGHYLLTPQRAHKAVIEEMAGDILRHINRMTLCDAVGALGSEIEIDLEDAET